MLTIKDQETLLQTRAENPDAVILVETDKTVEAYVPGDDDPVHIFRGWNRLLKAKLFALKVENAE
ncbi:MAG: hypothetical protein KJ995_08230 [Candidatus Omnitrophica bacterium]|nr:hypothetical protein [Candidatus Omnitrophota bacterium]MBU1657399.1 hypothetical protein [Candidatus Omnitrophota bacterium]MBU1785287.1 hypothetical protein [Candidatus Omnitrophota bacterium]MBU1852374.1 hypothetical protein [Candidatus Omnitrophota bacterium]